MREGQAEFQLLLAARDLSRFRVWFRNQGHSGRRLADAMVEVAVRRTGEPSSAGSEEPGHPSDGRVASLPSAVIQEVENRSLL